MFEQRIPMIKEQADIVLEYSRTSMPNFSGVQIRLYQDGRVEAVGIGTDERTMEDINEKIIKEMKITQEQVQAYAEQLVKQGFFDYEAPEGCVLDGLFETMILNYHGKQRSINSENQISRMLFPEITQELEALVGISIE